MTPRIGLATCVALPDLDADDRLLLEPLRALGIEAVPAIWDDASIDWAAFDLVVVRDTWDYTERRAAFVAWARSVPRLANPADVIEWNTDKRYLADLTAAGIPVVPTAWFSPGDVVVLPAAGRHVLKPAVGAGSLDVAAFSMHDAHESALARAHATRLLAAQRTLMIQPYIDAIDERGETGLIFVGGEFSHAVGKGPMLAGEHALTAGGLYMSETISPSEATDEQIDLARRALAAVPGGPDRLLYARVDMVPDASGAPLLIELELTEPSLFMATTPGSELRFAAAIAARL